MTEQIECILKALDSVNCEHAVCASCIAHQYCDGFLDYAAANAIKSLCAELEQTKHERDAAIKDIKELCTRHSYSSCAYCKYDTVDYGDEKCRDCTLLENWQWRGVKEESYD